MSGEAEWPVHQDTAKRSDHTWTLRVKRPSLGGYEVLQISPMSLMVVSSSLMLFLL